MTFANWWASKYGPETKDVTAQDFALMQDAYETGRKDEREACAKACEELRDDWGRAKIGAKDGRYDMMEEAASICEDEIRERSN